MESVGVRYARYGRVSTEDEQDPTLSFPRQLANSERRVAESARLLEPIKHLGDAAQPEIHRLSGLESASTQERETDQSPSAWVWSDEEAHPAIVSRD
jgi:hypothetical protein